MLDERGDVEVKIDADGIDCDPQPEWSESMRLLYLW
ncbi:hypothetical protein SEA_CEPENS_70 [Mycobacterium phage Cepens]|nr:hypothetical protein PBI_MEGABEAR_68 [Mycobacterium phage Megabear]QBP32752.1 hypothetical protein SEA_CEPENS_70 [Mycobacterium phage Cepens]BBC28594.1 hypothetical protein [Mycobacterium phage D12]BBC28684.1 hypothetical protein [Mycobacterium phage PR]